MRSHAVPSAERQISPPTMSLPEYASLAGLATVLR